MTEERAAYRSECNTIEFVHFGKNSIIDGPESFAEYVVTKVEKCTVIPLRHKGKHARS